MNGSGLRNTGILPGGLGKCSVELRQASGSDAWDELVSSGSRGQLVFSLVEGCLRLNVLHINGGLTRRASVTLDGTPAEVSCKFSFKALHLTFESALILQPGQKLVITPDASPWKRAG